MPRADREKWDARHAASEGGPGPAPGWLAAVDDALPRVGRALDVASGTGRLARWALARGLSVTAVDISPVGLARLKADAPDVATVERDLELDPTLPGGPYDLITCVRYRQRSLWPAMKAALARGGVLVAEVVTVANLERHAHPSRRWLAEPGELRELAEGLVLEHDEEGWLDGVCSARLVGRRTAS